MNRILDRDWNTPDEDKGPHYDPVRLVVDVIIERDTFGRMAGAEESAAKILDDGVAELNERFGCAHSVRPLIHMGTDDGYTDNEVRAAWGEALLDYLGAVTGADRESAFTDAVAYLLHAEMLRLAREEPKARDLLDAALDSFAGDAEDGPYAFE